MSFADTRIRVANALGFFWLKVFTDQDFVDGYTKSLAVPLADINRMVDELPEYQSRYTIPVKDVSDLRVLTFSEATLDRELHHYGDGLPYGTGAAYGQLSESAVGWNYAISADYSPAFLTPDVLGHGIVWTRGVDYVVVDGRIVFRNNPLDLAGLLTRPRRLADGSMTLDFMLWGFGVEEDLQAVQSFFGILAGIVGPSSDAYKQAVNIAWDLRVDGATMRNVKRLLSYISGVDYVDLPGQVRAVFTEGDRQCVLTADRVYTAPLGMAVLAVVGQTLAPGDLIFDAFAIRYGQDEVDFADFGGLELDIGMVGPGYRSGVFLGNAEVPVTRVHGRNWTYVEPV